MSSSVDSSNMATFKGLCSGAGLSTDGTLVDLQQRYLTHLTQCHSSTVPVVAAVPMPSNINVIDIQESAKKLPVLSSGIAPYRFTFQNQAKQDLKDEKKRNPKVINLDYADQICNNLFEHRKSETL